MNGQNASESLSDWLMSDGSPPHIYAIGFQELDLSKEAFLFNDSVREEEWRAHVEKYLHSDGKYTLVSLLELVVNVQVFSLQCPISRFPHPSKITLQRK